MMRIIRANALGMCFGVRDAIALAQQKAGSGPLTILGDLVHNEQVMADLLARGVRVENRLENVATQEVLITAHGAAQRVIQQARALGLNVEEATCPLVHYAHRQLHRLVAAGFYPVVVGQRHHVEVRGLTGDLDEYSVILNPEDVDSLPSRPAYGIVAQTTQPLSRVQALVEKVQARFPEAKVSFVDTVCKPTKERQQAAEELARRCDVVVVIGGAHSNNTRELVATCRRHCPQVYHVQGPDDLRPEWLAAAEVVGITAGTSTPDAVIDAVEARLKTLANAVPVASPATHHLAAVAVAG